MITKITHVFINTAISLLILSLVSCGGGSSSESVAPSTGTFLQSYTSSGTLVLTEAKTVKYLIVAGGGSGGDGNAPGGGGGGGGVVTGQISLPAGNYPIVVGAGGLARNPSEDEPGNSGEDSSFAGIVAKGGGGGGGVLHCDGFQGGSGGGASGPDCDTPGTRIGGVSNQTSPINGLGHGHTGGNYVSGSGGGGGGGAGATAAGINGGVGISSDITGTANFYGGGGGGATSIQEGGTMAGQGGSGGGGTGGFDTSSNGSSGLPNTGGGGGGSSDGLPGNGGSGLVVIKY
jgi:hypothetical protein